LRRAPAFQAFVDRKTREATTASLTPLRTLEDRTPNLPLQRIGNVWTRRFYDGDFHLFEAPPDRPAMSMVFVQSRDGNTAVENPGELGGGPVDTHLIYEGLSRVAADGVLAGAATVTGPDVFFSVWHPELVSLRHDCHLPRHPAQIVVSRHGRLDVNALLFNVPEVPVFLVAGPECHSRSAASIAERPWVTVVPMGHDGLVDAFTQLRREHGVKRISVVGGRTTASALVDAGLIRDLCLTTTARAGGERDTPYYVGRCRPTLDVIVRKESTAGPRILCEHFALLSF
jgi:riboflavin biosynthesis pyrimidine reductase